MSETLATQELSRRDRYVVLVAAFLGWLLAGCVMASGLIAGRPALKGLGLVAEDEVGLWFSGLLCAFLLGAAVGGLVLGWVGDRFGRTRGAGISMLIFAAGMALTPLAATPTQLLILRFLACLGVGGMWPNGVALVSEAWASVSRPLLAGVIGASANVGFVVMGLIARNYAVIPESWGWFFVLVSVPAAIVGAVTLVAVPESPLWRAQKAEPTETKAAPVAEVFGPTLIRRTLIGICLGTIPLLGNWGATTWVTPWADQVGGDKDVGLKGTIEALRSVGSVIGSLMGGWLASLFGRRTLYFVISLLAVLASGYLFRSLTPADPAFKYWVVVVGFLGVVYFGWLPLYLPELFPTRVRSTGSGVSFNFGRILAIPGVFLGGKLLEHFDGDYARAGQTMSLIFALGMVVICFAPDTSRARMED